MVRGTGSSAGGGRLSFSGVSRVLTGMLFALGIPSAVMGQQTTQPSKSVSQAVIRIVPPGGVTFFTGITLSDAQKAQLDAIKQTFAPAFKAFAATTNAAVKAQHRHPNAQERATADSLRRANLAAIRNVLTAAQQTQFDANLQRMAVIADSLRQAFLAAQATQTLMALHPPAPTAVTIPALVPAPTAGGAPK